MTRCHFRTGVDMSFKVRLLDDLSRNFAGEITCIPRTSSRCSEDFGAHVHRRNRGV
jgi:hypothetical protein